MIDQSFVFINKLEHCTVDSKNRRAPSAILVRRSGTPLPPERGLVRPWDAQGATTFADAPHLRRTCCAPAFVRPPGVAAIVLGYDISGIVWKLAPMPDRLILWWLPSWKRSARHGAAAGKVGHFGRKAPHAIGRALVALHRHVGQHRYNAGEPCAFRPLRRVLPCGAIAVAVAVRGDQAAAGCFGPRGCAAEIALFAERLGWRKP